MFGTGSGGGWSILGPSSQTFLEQERHPPARALPLEFPNHVPPRTSHPLSRRRMLSFRSSLIGLRKPSDVSDGLLAHLNIHFEPDVPTSELVPPGHFEERPFTHDADLHAMLTELDTSNEDAYREVMRMPPLEGRQKPRLTYSRNFFASLEDMRRYYDDSEDHYYEVDMTEEEKEEERRKRQKEGPTGAEQKDGGKPDQDQDGDSSMTDNDTALRPSTESSNGSSSNLTASEKPFTKQVYKGLRLGNSTSLPQGTRVAAVRNLLKMVTHKFICRDYDTSSRERLRITSVNVPPVPSIPTFLIVKIPSEMKLARGRFVEGPLISVNVRSDAIFTEKGRSKAVAAVGPEMQVSEVQGAAFDLSREIATLLATAMQRDREGKGSKEENAQKESERWWVRQKRWGGGAMKWGQLPFEVYEDEDPSWSAKEKELQMEKKRQAEEEMLKMPADIDGSGSDLKTEDLIAGSKDQNQEKMSGKEDGEEKASDGRAERGPPKKKNRIDIATRPDLRSSQDGENDSYKSDANGNLRASSRKKKEDIEQFHDGRRVMYVPPSKKKWYKDWEQLRPNASTWDDKMIYKRIGRPSTVSKQENIRQAEDDGSDEKQDQDDGDNGGWDEIFQVTSINHHVALMKMRISKRYLQWLETGNVEKREEGREDDVLRVYRTKWFDMFDVGARKEFLVGMWRVMCYLCREEVKR